MSKQKKYIHLIKTYHNFTQNPIATDNTYKLEGKIKSRALIRTMSAYIKGLDQTTGSPTTFRIQAVNSTDGAVNIYSANFSDVITVDPRGIGLVGIVAVNAPSDLRFSIEGGTGSVDRGEITIYIEYVDLINLNEVDLE